MSKQKSNEHVSKNSHVGEDGNDTNQVSKAPDVNAAPTKKLSAQYYDKELKKLHIELVKLQEWIRHKGLRVVVVFEGRDAAGKGGAKHWKLSPMDLESIARWEDYSRAKDDMFGFSDIPEAPWHVVHADDKKRARLNCISHLLSLIAYDSVPKPPLELPERPQEKCDYTRPPLTNQRFVPDRY